MTRRRKPRQGFVAYFDGCCEPTNPGGTAGYGAVILQGEERIWETSGMIPASPTTSNNVAEYLAFIAILERFIEIGMTRANIIVYGDSKLVIEQGFGTWKIRGIDHKLFDTPGFYAQYAVKARELLRGFTNIRGFWIPRDQNSICDELSKKQLRDAGIEFRIQPEARP